MATQNPFDLNLRGLGKSSECDGTCEKCAKSEFCVFSNAPKLRTSGYMDSSDEAFNARVLDVFGFKTRYGPSDSRIGEGFSNPYRNGSNTRSYSIGDYRKDFGISKGFQGSYGEGEGYSGITPKAGKASYCGDKGCGK